MIEGSGEPLTPKTSSSFSEIATAPGDLPLPEVDARFSALQWQFRHDNTIDPLAPRPGEAVRVWATSGVDLDLQRASLLYTTDGSDPGSDSLAVPMEIEGV